MPTATDFGCTQCAAKGIHVRVMQNGTNFSCANGHIYNGTDELYASNPPKMPLPAKAPVIMLPGYVKTEIAIPGNLKTALESKFGARLNATVVAILTAIMDPGAFVMSSEDVGQISKYFAGKSVRHGADLVGEIFSIYQERQNLKDQVEKKESVSFSGGLMVRPSPETLAHLKQVASANGKSASQVAAECLETAVKNSWL